MCSHNRQQSHWCSCGVLRGDTFFYYWMEWNGRERRRQKAVGEMNKREKTRTWMSRKRNRNVKERQWDQEGKRKSERKGQRDGQTDRQVETEFGPAPNQCNHSPYRTDTRSVGTRREREGEGGRWRDRRRYLKRKKQQEEALAGRLHPSNLVLQPFYWPWWAFWLVSNKGWFKKQPYLEEIPEVVWGDGGGGGSYRTQPSQLRPTPHPHR